MLYENVTFKSEKYSNNEFGEKRRCYLNFSAIFFIIRATNKIFEENNFPEHVSLKFQKCIFDNIA